MTPETRYAQSGDVNIAYQVVGNGALDLVFVMGWVSNVDEFWTEPALARFLTRLTSFSRLIVFDKRGTGLSDRVHESDLPTLEQRMDDVRAVLDAVHSRRAALFGVSEGGPMCTLFAATYPERTAALIMFGSFARRIRGPDYPWGRTEAELDRHLKEIKAGWGGPVGLEARAPSVSDDERFRRWWATYLTRSASPGAAIALARMNAQIDIRHVLPAIRVPALIMHRSDDRLIEVRNSQYMAERIPGAKFVEFPGDDHLPWVGDQDAVLDEIEEFLTGTRRGPEPDRVLATVLFIDIVGSTQKAVEMGDRRWRDLLAGYHTLARGEVERFRGREIDIAGDGILAAFDGPARAVRCACAVRDAVKGLGMEVRAGLHTGEVELMGDNLGGIAVHIGARVVAQAGAGQVLVSSTVKDLVAGSGLAFEDQGRHTLKGVPGEWQLFSVVC